jgi:hypothetical protein
MLMFRIFLNSAFLLSNAHSIYEIFKMIQRPHRYFIVSVAFIYADVIIYYLSRSFSIEKRLYIQEELFSQCRR